MILSCVLRYYQMVWYGIRWSKMHQWFNRIPGKFCHCQFGSPHQGWPWSLKSGRFVQNSDCAVDIWMTGLGPLKVQWAMLNESWNGLFWHFMFTLDLGLVVLNVFSHFRFLVMQQWTFGMVIPNDKYLLGWVETTRQESRFQWTFLGRPALQAAFVSMIYCNVQETLRFPDLSSTLFSGTSSWPNLSDASAWGKVVKRRGAT